MRHKPYIPAGISELLDKLASMMLGEPLFRDRAGYFPEKTIDTEFFALNEGLSTVRETVGDERYAALRALSDKMRVLFESDPDDTNGGAKAGRKLIREMENILTSTAKPRASK